MALDFYGRRVPLPKFSPSPVGLGFAEKLAAASAKPAPSAKDKWNQYVESILGPLRAANTASSVSDRASRNAAIQRAVIGFGEVPANLNSLGLPASELDAILDPTTRSLASQNTAAKTSTVARLMEADALNRRDIANSLGARGMYDSGELGYGLGQQQTAYTRAQYDARNELADYIMGVQSGFAEAERQRKMAEIQAAMGLEPPEGYGEPDPTTEPAGVTAPVLPQSGIPTAQANYYLDLAKGGFATPFSPGEPVKSKYANPYRRG